MKKHEFCSCFRQRLCLFVGLFLLSLINSAVYGQKISVDFSHVTIEQAIEILKNQEGYSFILKADDVNLKKRVNVKFRSKPIEEVLTTIFAGEPVTFSVEGKMVRINKKKLQADNRTEDQKQEIEISGKVTDKNGDALIGVSITEKGTKNGTITDLNGNYKLVTTNFATIHFSYLGYEVQERKVGKDKKINIILEEQVNALNEVVVVGYGVMKKSDLTGAVSSIKTEDLPKSSNISISHMLSGKAAGVTAIQNSAQPGGGVEMLIRGAASTGAGNEPLYIIDGFPVNNASIEPSADNRYTDFGSRNPLNSINPNDIESIEILKDASSTAIYGARAANGVIIITTKKGREGRAVVTYNASYSMQKIANRIEMMTASEYMNEANKFKEEQWYYNNRIYPYGNTDPATVTEKLILPYSEKDIAKVGAGTDWYDQVTQNGMIHQQNVSVSGGTNKLKYMASFNYMNQEGVVKNTDFTRYTGRINIEHEISKIFSYGINATQSYIRSTNVPLGTEDFENSGLLNSALSYDPTIPVKDKDGNYTQSPLMTTVPNPASMLEIDDYTTTKRLLVNAYVQAQLLKGLVAKVNLGFDDQTGIRNSYVPKSTLYGKQEGGKASKSMASQFDKLIELTLNYTAEFSKKHKINVLGGFSYQSFLSEGMAASNSQFFTDAFKYNSLMTGEAKRPTVSSYKSENVLQSFFGRINYNLMDKYLFTFTARVDGSNKFGENNRYGFFPSAAIAWRIKQENFLKNIKPISDLKLRLSYGQTGNSNIGNNAFEYYTAAWKEYVFGNAVSTGTGKSQLGNPNLKWETVTEFNLGVDFGFFDQRFSGSFEYFSKEIKDLLGYRTLKSFMELSTVAANIGKTQSKGFELSLRSQNLTGPLQWSTEFNFTRYVDRWKERSPEDVLNPWQKVDDPIRAHYGYLSDGILGIGETPPASMEKLLPGQYKIKDVNGYLRDEFGNLVMDENGKVQYVNKPDGMIDEADIVLLGTYDPGFSIGLGNSFEYKGFDLNIFFYGMFDRIVNNATRGKFSIPEIRRILTGQNLMKEVSNRWSRNNPNSDLPSGFVSVYPEPSDYLWEKAWFIRCKNITLGYTLPQKLVHNIFTKARVFVDVSNPFVITPYTGNDPETDFKAGYPNQRTYTVGIDVTF